MLTPPPPTLTDNGDIPLMQKTFRYRKICQTEKGTLRSIQENETENFPTENRNTPPLCIKFSNLRGSLKHVGTPTNFFGLVRLKFFNGNSWNSPIMLKVYGCPNLSKSLKSFQQKFRLCETKKPTISWYPILQKFLIPEHFWNTRVPLRNFLVLWDNKDWQNRVTPKTQNNFLNQNNSDTQNGSPTLFFGDVRQKFSDGKTWRPFLIHCIFPTRNFLKHRRVRPRCFSVTWDKKILTVKRDTHLLIPKFFHTRSFWKHKRVPLRNFSVLRNRKISKQNGEIPLLSIKFFNTWKKWNTEGFTYKSFGTVRHKKSAGNRANPPPTLTDKGDIPLMQKIFHYRKLCQTEKGTLRSIQENETKNFPTENRNTPPPQLCIKFSNLRNSLKHVGTPTIFFGLVGLKFFNGKSWNSPIMHKVYGCPNSSKSLKSFQQKFRLCETKTIKRIMIPLLSKKFRYQKISETQGSPYEISRYCETKKIDKIVIPLLSKHFFDSRTFLKHRRVRPWCFVVIWDKQFPTEKRDTPLLTHIFFPY